MNKFKVGDVVKGPSDGSYLYTTDKATMTVVEIENHPDPEIRVRVDHHEIYPDYIGQTWWVKPSRMTLIRHPYTNDF